MGLTWSDPPTNSGIMDFNCNFPAKIAQQPRDQNQTIWEAQSSQSKLEFAEILLDKIPFGQRERQQCRDEFAKGQILLRTNFVQRQILLRDKFC